MKNAAVGASSLVPALRHAPGDLDGFLSEHFQTRCEGNGQTQVRVHLLRWHSGHPRIADLAAKVAGTVTSYAIPRSEIQAAIAHATTTGSTERIDELNKRARGLFADVDESGEGGEALLYLMAETILRLPQVLCKMSLKTSSQVHYHGVDGVHAEATADGLALYWGESKLYGTASTAIAACLSSIAPFLKGVGGSTASEARDLQLLRANLDLGDPRMEQAFKEFLDPNHANFLRMSYRGLCLVGFDEADYPNPDALLPARKATFAGAIKRWVKLLDKGVTNNGLSSAVIEMMFVPMPAVDDYRKAIRSELGLDFSP